MKNPNNSIYKTVIIENFDKLYYKKLRRSLPQKIENGEIEWIYSYGEKLVKRGNITVLKKIRGIVKTKECDNPYISPEALYKRCIELKNKFWWMP